MVVGGDDLTDELCQTLGAYGATKVFRAKGPEGLAQPVVDVMAKVIDDNGHGYALFGGGLLGFEIGAGLAARKQAGVTMEVTAVRAEDGKLVAERPILRDSKISVSHYRGDLGIIIGRINAFEIAREPATAPPRSSTSTSSTRRCRPRPRWSQRGEQRGADVDIEGADILVAGGRGLGKAEGFELAEALAEAFGGNSRRRRDPRGRRRRLVPVRGPDRPDRQDRVAEAVSRGRDLRRDPAQGRDAVLGEHRRDQQGRQRADLRVLRPRDRRRSEQDPAQADRGDQGQEGELTGDGGEQRSPSRAQEFPPPVDSVKEFIKRGLDAEDELIEVGVAIVGGGTAGLACANRLLQLLADDPALMERLGEVPVAVIEKAKTCGGHNLSGAVMRPGPLQELFPDMSREDWRKERFAFGEVTKEAVYVLPSAKTKLPVPIPSCRTSRTTATRSSRCRRWRATSSGRPRRPAPTC